MTMAVLRFALDPCRPCRVILIFVQAVLSNPHTVSPSRHARSPFPSPLHVPPTPDHRSTPRPPPTHSQRPRSPHSTSTPTPLCRATCNALPSPARHVAALKQPAELAPCVRRTYGGYGAVEDGFRRRRPPIVLGPVLPLDLAEVPNCNCRAMKNSRCQRTIFRCSLLQQLVMARCSSLASRM